MDLKNYFASLKKELTDKIASSALGYLGTGLNLFHKTSKDRYRSIQPVIGNLTIAIELMIKTHIVKHNPSLLFIDLPLELQMYFANSEKLNKNFNWRIYDIDLRCFNYKTIDLNKCINMFYIYFPEHKQELRVYFDILSKCRNSCVHASLPSFQKYDLNRISYLAIRVFEILDKGETFIFVHKFLSDKDKGFLKSYKKEKIEDVKRKIDAAKKKAKTIPDNVSISYDKSWYNYETNCPICKSNGFLTGYTEIEPDEHNEFANSLSFYAESFECEFCGLKLNDMTELELANMEIFCDRTDEIEKWYEEHYGEPDFDDMREQLQNR